MGTNGLKAVLLDANGWAIDEATIGYELHSPDPGWSEPVQKWTRKELAPVR